MRLRAGFLIFVVLILATALAQAAGGAASTGTDDVVGSYLALGDSISFGFLADAGYEYVNPGNFIGFADYITRSRRMELANASCPGETTGSFSSSSAPDRGCRYYRSLVPLHVPYASTQMDFATAFLKAHPETKLITIDLGANDVLLLEDRCENDFSCIAAGLPQVLAGVTASLQTIVSGLRGNGFHGKLVMVNYYSTDYSDPNVTYLFSSLNQSIAAAAVQMGVPVADVFTSFQKATIAAGGHTCEAGLLKASPANEFTCDIHPSQTGQQLIARTVQETLDD
jgi:lysophospholipase L1-like esterase